MRTAVRRQKRQEFIHPGMQQTAEYIATHHDFFGQSHQQAEHKGSKQIQRIELKPVTSTSPKAKDSPKPIK